MSGGTVNLSRDFWDDDAFRSEPFTQREAFLWFITEASWKDRTRRFGETVVHLNRGELVASVRFMAKAWKWTPAKVQRFLEKLKSSEKICLKIDTGLTVVSVCKYDQYQNKPSSVDTAPIQHRYSTDTNENKGEIRGKEKKEDNAGEKPAAVRLKMFEEFWSVYPAGNYTADKSACRRKYLKAVKAGTPERQIVAAAKAYSKNPNVASGYVKNPGNWLSAEGWKAQKSEQASTATTQPDDTLLHFEAEREKQNAAKKAKRGGGPSYTLGSHNPQAASYV